MRKPDLKIAILPYKNATLAKKVKENLYRDHGAERMPKGHDLFLRPMEGNDSVRPFITRI